MRTTQQWWDEVSNSPEKMVEWLKAQYHGEVTASQRILDLLIQYPDITDTDTKLIIRIAQDEAKHAAWVKELLVSRGIDAKVLVKEERYWDKTLPTEPVSFQRMCAIGHHAEVMRLDRIMLLACVKDFSDIAQVFKRIRTDEVFHARAFAVMSTPEDIDATRDNHEAGKAALGL